MRYTSLPHSILLSIFVLVVFSICPLHAVADQEISIGLMTELSGSSAPNGVLCRNGFEVARHLYARSDAVGNKKIRFVYGDTQGQGPAGISEFKRLTEAEHAIAVVGNRSQVCMAVNPVSEAKAVPLIGIVGHAHFTKTNKYAYRFWPTAEQEGEAVAKRILADGFTSAAVFTTEDQWTISLTESFVKHFTTGGGTIALQENIDPLDIDFGTLVNKLRRNSAPALFLNMTLAHIGPALKRIREFGVQTKLYSNYWASNPDTLAVAGSAVRGVIFNEPDPSAAHFVQALKELFPNDKPLASQYTCYLGLAALLKTIETHPEVVDASSLISALSSQSEIKLLDGALKFNGRDAQIPIRFGTL